MLWRVLESYGIDPADIVPADMYRPGTYIGRDSYVRSKDYYPVIANAIRAIDDEAVGIRAAELMQPSHLGVLGHAWLASPSLLSSYRMLERFGRVFFGDLRVELREQADTIELAYDPNPVSPFPEATADAEVGGIVRFSKLQYGEAFSPLSITLRRTEPARRKTWDDFFGVTVDFGAAENLVRIDPAQAGEILTTAHVQLFQQHQEALAASQAGLEASDLETRVRLAIEQLLPAGAVPEARVASLVDVSTRTLHRRLSEDGKTFRSLLKDVRMHLATRYLVNDRYNATEVAFMLGYSDSSAFSRAFKSWFGVAPSEFLRTETSSPEESGRKAAPASSSAQT
jgi:AraC-like DNA-binding protein